MKKNSLFLKQIPRRIKKLILRDYIEKYLKKKITIKSSNVGVQNSE